VYNDILGKEENKKVEVSKDSIIHAQKVNIEAKQEMIDELLDRITELEREVEELRQSDTCTGI
jgi:cell division protein FtsB